MGAGRRNVPYLRPGCRGADQTGLLRVFFFQAEEGIRDVIVTGVQTCALPISAGQAVRWTNADPNVTVCSIGSAFVQRTAWPAAIVIVSPMNLTLDIRTSAAIAAPAALPKIGRASCRERV